MRLICPNCGQSYTVADTAIPAAGRKVKCGVCKTEWHQAAATPDQPDPAAEIDIAAPPAGDAPASEPSDSTPPAEAGAATPPLRGEPPEAAVEDISTAQPVAREDLDMTALRDILASPVDASKAAPAPEAAAAPDPGSAPEVDTPSEPDETAGPDVTPGGAATSDTEIPPLPGQDLSDSAASRIRSEIDTAFDQMRNSREQRRAARPDTAIAEDTEPPQGEARDATPEDTGETEEVLTDLRRIFETEEKSGAPLGSALQDGINPGAPRRRARPPRPSGPPPTPTAPVPTPEVAEDEEDAVAAPAGRSRTAMGFALAVMVFAIATALYLMSPALAQMVPAAAPVLESYTSGIDTLRQMIEGAAGTI